MAGIIDSMARWLSGSRGSDSSTEMPRADESRVRSPEDLVGLPDASRPRVARLLSLIADIEARSRDEVLLVSALTEVRQMRDVHLPQLVASYAEIPPAHRAEIFRATGKSASYNLSGALDRMIGRLEALSRTMAQDDIETFADNLRFIEHRYGGDDSAP